MPDEFFGPLPPSDFNRDQDRLWLGQQVISFQKIITGSLQADNELSSANYVAGTSGWMIDGDGNAEFNDVTVRGDLVSGNWDGADPPNLATVDTGASAGFAFDSSEGAAQFVGGLFVGGNLDLVEAGVGVGILRLFEGEPDETSEQTPGLVGASLGGSGTTQTISSVFRSPAFEANATRPRVQMALKSESFDESTSPLTVAFQVVGTANLTPRMALGNGMVLSVGDGSLSLPGIRFEGADTGFYRIAASADMGISVNGTAAGRWRDDGLLFPGGGAASPSVSFIGDTDTGMYLVSGNALGFATNGNRMMWIGTGGIVMEGWVGIEDSLGIRFNDDTNTGISRGGDDIFSIVTGGGTIAHFNGQSSAIHAGSSTTGGFWINTAAGGGGVSAPTYSFRSDGNTGMFRQGADEIGFAAGGVLAAVFGNGGSGSYLVLRDGLTDVGNHETLRLDRGTGTTMKVVGYFSSWINDPETGELRKDEIMPVAESPAWKREYFKELRPIYFRRISTGEHELGFGLDNFKEIDDSLKYLTTKGDKWGYSPDEFALLAVTVDYVQEMDRRLERLERMMA